MKPVTLTFTEENYLKAIYSLSGDTEFETSTTQIAERLHTRPPTVSDMLRKLADKKLISYEKYKNIELTKTGRQLAILIIRKHRLWEVFLHDKLEFAWDEVHDIAEQLEHIQSEQLIARLDKFLGYPKYDPHGDPIPSAQGELIRTQRIALSELDPGQGCQVVGVKDSSPLFLQYMQQVNIAIGTKIKVIAKIAFDKSLIVSLRKGHSISVSKKFADNVLVTV